MKRFDVLTIGLQVIDLMIPGMDGHILDREMTLLDHAELTLGGDALNQAIVLSQLGARTALMGAAGVDRLGDVLLQQLSRYPLSVFDRRIDVPTAICVVLIDEAHERHFLFQPGQNLALRYEDLDEAVIRDSAFVSVGGAMALPELDGEGLLKLFTLAHASGARTALDMRVSEREYDHALLEACFRKTDYFLLSVLSGIAQSAMKFSGDIRLLSHLKAVDEPFEAGQVGSSAMAYKRNPMRSERITSLARYVIADAMNPAMTAGTQWLERTLDDSANRRISIPEAFLATDGLLTLYINVVRGLRVYPKVLEKQLREELPFLATENILMYCVKKGGDRQTLHEAIRRHSVAAGRAIKEEGADNDLLERIAADPVFPITRQEIEEILRAGGFTGMAAEQTADYLRWVRALLKENRTWLAQAGDAAVTV